jgi:hypothetical protein
MHKARYKHSDVRSVSELLEQNFTALSPDRVSLRWIIDAFHERGFGFLVFLFVIPMALPIPKPPGLSTILALPLLLLTFQQMMGRHSIWLPKVLLDKSFSTEQFSLFIHKSLPWIKRLEKILKPRLGFMTQGLFSLFIGLSGVIMTLFIMLPLPFTNSIAGIGVALMGMGVVMRDGLTVIIGMLVGFGWICVYIYVVLYFGVEGIEMITRTFTSML